MDQRLYNSAKLGDILHCKELLNENPSLLLKLTPHENTTLHIATQFGHKNIVAEIYNRQQSLLAQPNLDGDTPLHVAARADRISIVGFLIEEMLSSSYRDIVNRGNRGIEILRMRNKWGNTVLHEAVRNHNLRVTEFLIKVDPGLACFENNTGESPLYLAARDGMLTIVKRILMAACSLAYGGCDGSLVRAKPELIKEADHHGRTPLYYAASMGDCRTVQRLLQLHTDIVYMSDQDGVSPLHVAAYRGHTNIIKEIIKCCPDSGELLDLRGQNTLHFAVLGGKSSVVRYILETTELEGLINQANNDGNTPLHLATREGNSWIARYLIWDERVDQRAKNNIGQTAIDYEESIRKAYSRFPKRQPWSRNTWTTKEKIPPSTSEEGATAPAADKMETYKQMGHALLMVATLIATVTFAAAFTIPRGFNNNVGPDQGQALLQSSLHLKWFLVSDSIAMSFSVIAACILFWGDVIEALVRSKPELIKEADHHGRTPLYYATSMGDHRTVQRLLQLDTDIAYMSNKESQSPFHVAAYRGHTNIIKEIIQYCPDSGELLDLRGQNILHIAVLCGKLSVVRYILETTELEGLINQADNDGNTPLHLATIERKSWIARYLMWDDRVDERAKNNIGQKAINNESTVIIEVNGIILMVIFVFCIKTSGIWRQPWSQNTWITRENIPLNTIEDGVATVDKMRAYKQMGHSLLMVATLSATVTFAAAFTIPGGFNNNVGLDQGQALLQSSTYLKWLLVSDSIAMSSSVVVACILFWGAVIAKENYFYYFASGTMLTHIALSSTGSIPNLSENE
ncbi:Protein ACCELERATED CELL DEATH 6 [Camellia lanceoleosa]|uniref:Protein ACCELERATED CELL DEATH 6 n=1 Tax=Camellia lanceoleosa TaxID=1840588 RepID=A0ACC0H6K0_9ERIC|nr:Protein ACCELERATED CELL DEATH 6 [Camellia lanceoleosa]